MEFIVKLTRQEIAALVGALDLAIDAEINLEDRIAADPTAISWNLGPAVRWRRRPARRI